MTTTAVPAIANALGAAMGDESALPNLYESAATLRQIVGLEAAAGSSETLMQGQVAALRELAKAYYRDLVLLDPVSVHVSKQEPED